ncbi:rod shape-determining protein MreC [Phaeobacter sp. QD34_3]|uniref:rod shape-determining protein MreC n=1 Tax=unclassified Phaeobacter TaxID=2621772 RepID=UPI00237F6171|nr:MULTISPECIES: rod shape-determining protein MreC [unclassified Phaeobacter]MDE4134097.1 rod shape-determining protein MreC [Phaeobacter sp. QD34_3]MDE4137839.1 rod shape-determining protein MreC [Phaeobacter sp. QD34_24]
MAKDRSQREDFSGPLRRLLIGLVCLCLAAIFLVWRIDSPRVERFRAQLVDTVVPSMDWAMVPVTGAINLVRDFQSYQRLSEQNRELRSELRQMRAWKEAALQLEQENARLLDLNNVRLDPKLTYITGVVMADSGSPFRQSVILNIGARDGIQDGWAAMDGIGLVGRISGTGQDTARVILLTDAASAVPAVIQPSGQTALVTGDNTAAPVIDFLENPDLVRAGDRVITSGDGSVFPPGLLIGQVAADRAGRKRVRLSADYERLEFLRVLRHQGAEAITEPGALVVPPPDAALLPERSGDPAPQSLSSQEGGGNG